MYFLVIVPQLVEKLDRGYEQLITGQEDANTRGNATIKSFAALFDRLIDNSEHATNIEENVIGNLTDHRIIANNTRDDSQAMLKEILNILGNQSR